MAKRTLLENIVWLRNVFRNGVWCFVRDFNSLSGREERKGVNEDHTSNQLFEMTPFNNIGANIEVEYVNLGGGI